MDSLRGRCLDMMTDSEDANDAIFTTSPVCAS
jgi:hypothetical protein